MSDWSHHPRVGLFRPLLFIILAGIAPVAVWSGSVLGAEPTSIKTSSTILVLVWSAFELSGVLSSSEVRIAQAVFWLFVYLSYGVASLAQDSLKLYPGLVDTEYLDQASWTVLLGLACYSIGYRMASRDQLSEDSGVGRAFRVVDSARVPWLVAISFVLTIFYIRYFGITTFFSSRRELGGAFADAGLRDDSQVGSAFLTTFGTTPVFISFIIVTHGIFRSRTLRRPAWLLVLALLIVLNAIVNNPIVNPRYWILTIVITFVFAIPRVSPQLFRWTFCLGIAMATFIFPYSDYFRTPADQREIVTIGVFQTLATKDYDQMTMTANGLWYTDHHGFQMGQQILGWLFFFVPRSIWPSKGLDTGVLIGDSIGGANVNLSSTLWTEGWVDFGYVGVIAFLTIFAVISARLDCRFLLSLRTTASVTSTNFRLSSLLIPLLAGYTFIILRGPLLQAMSRLGVILFVCFLVSRHEMSQRIDQRSVEKGVDDPQ